MYCVRNVTEDLYWVGANDHRLTLFENIHPIPRGVSYNAYLLLDEKTVLFDTVDWSACTGSRRIHRRNPAPLPQSKNYQHPQGLHADASVRL